MHLARITCNAEFDNQLSEPMEFEMQAFSLFGRAGRLFTAIDSVG